MISLAYAYRFGLNFRYFIKESSRKSKEKNSKLAMKVLYAIEKISRKLKDHRHPGKEVTGKNILYKMSLTKRPQILVLEKNVLQCEYVCMMR